MSIVDPASGTRNKSDDIPKRLLEPVGRLLGTGDSAATVDRLFVSQHVKDLRLIIAFASIGVILVFLIGAPLAVKNAWIANPKWNFTQVLFSGSATFLTFFIPVLGVFGAVLAWAYQAGSARLGIVDLFACEIDTLCRVALVVDSVPRSIETFEEDLPGPNGAGSSASTTRHFTSEENYFPVFENTTRDLQALEARVVVNITAFYTYMKAVRDSTRALMDMAGSRTQPDPQPNKASTSTPWQEATRNVIYMMFLGLESARKAIKYLVEFEPEQAERTIVILISELEAYRFLREQFVDKQDIRHQRLDLREADYRKLVPSLCNVVEAGRASEGALSLDEPSQWEPALRLVPELKRKYDAVMAAPSQPYRLAATA